MPGATASGTIDLISRTSVAGVLTSFKTLLLEGKKVVESSATEESSEGLMRQQVESDPNSIGFLSNYQADKGGLNSVGFNGVACNQTTAASGQYAGVAVFYEVTKGTATGAASAFINWIDKSAPAQQDHRHASGSRSARPQLLERLRKPWPDHRAERTLGAVSLLVGVGRRRDGRVRRDPARGRSSSTTASAGWARRRQPRNADRNDAARRAPTRRPRPTTCAPGR